MNRARILGIEYVLPDACLSNDELDRRNPHWEMTEVVRKTGVANRRIVGPDETALDMAVTAGRRLLERMQMAPAEIDGVIFCTQTPDYLIPGNAPLFQHRLGLPTGVFGFDLRFGCSGFVYALFLAKSLIESGLTGKILIATSETISHFDSPDDRATVSLFGDGGAVALVGSGPIGLRGFDLGTDGSGLQDVLIPAGGARLPRSATTCVVLADEGGNLRSQDHLYMDGLKVLNFVKAEMPKSVKRLLAGENLKIDDISRFFFHQASGIALDFLQTMLRVPPAKVFRNLAQIGNTSSAAIPVALRDAELSGLLTRGDRLVLCAFGAGYSRASCILDW